MGKYVDGINEERFDNFLKDLRSGEYKQGRSALHTVDKYDDDTVDVKFCCLGVACIRPAAEGVVEVSHPCSGGYMVKYDGYNGTDLPNKVADYLGIPSENRVDGGSDSTDVAFFKLGYTVGQEGLNNGMTAIGLNDRYGKSFSEIADAFEKEFTRE